MDYKWNVSYNKKVYDMIKKDAVNANFNEDELAKSNLSLLNKQTKSKRILRMIHLAFYLGMLKCVKTIDEGKTPICLR